MEQIGLIARIVDCAAEIDQGRKWLDTEGLEATGRTSYRNGLAYAMDVFLEAHFQAAKDLASLILSEKAFITQELQFCDPSDTQTSNSLTQAIQGLDDALLALEAVDSASAYYVADMTFPHRSKYRVKGMPKDSFHIACISHRTRIGNIIRSPGINLAEKKLLAQRTANLTVAQAAYLDKQKTALAAYIIK
ncbi:MAG: hypothetical protein LBL26_03430 [Peptococcaceae bacterium]|nr:hypothetical protein [Peptococcaceae bacterium]